MKKTIIGFCVFLSVLSMAFARPSSEENGMLRIGVVVKSLSNDHWLMVRAGAMAAGEDLGVEVEFLGPNAETDIMQQTAMMEDLITKKVDALVVAPSQPLAAVAIFEKADAAGIPILLIDTNAPFANKVSFIGTGNYNGGKVAGEYIVKALGSGKTAVIVRGALGDLTHDERTNGAKDALEAGGIQVLEIQPADSDRAKALSVMENMLQKHGNVDAVFGTSDAMTLGALRGIMQAGKGEQIMVVGFDGEPDALKQIKEGNMAGSVAQSPYNIGYFGVEEAVKAAQGKMVEKRIDTGTIMIDTTNVEKAEMDQKNLLSK